MNFFTENILWIFALVFALQLIKVSYHGRLLWLREKKKSKFNRERRKLKLLIVDKV